MDSLTPLEETLRALEDLVRGGKVRYVGCCSYPAWQVIKGLAIADAHDWSRFVSLQAYYTLASRDAERELLPLVRDQGLALLVWSPLAGGLLSGKFGRESQGPADSRRARFDFPPVDRERAYNVIDALRQIGAARGCSPARVALAWLLHQPTITSVILGARRPDQLADNLAAAGLALTADELESLDQVSALPPEYPGWMLAHPWDERVWLANG